VDDLLARGAPAERAPVRTMARHRVERVCPRKDPRAERDLVFREPVGIPTTVPALMVRADDLQSFSLEERDAREHGLTENRVRLHTPTFCGAERPGLLQDPVGNPDLPDVVEQEAVRGALILGEALGSDCLRECGRVALDALRMRARSRVLRLEGTRER